MPRPVALFLLGGLFALSAELGAQSMPPITQAKRVARNAVAKTDAHTQQMQTTEGAQGSQSAAGAQSAPTTQSTSTTSEPVRTGDESSVSVRGGKDEVGFRREAFSYERSGRRDPFLSLLHSHDLRPMINDLKLVAVLYDPVGRSWAVMRDMTTKEQYRVKVGQQLGRMRVSQIHPKSVTFTIEEIGFSRQQTLALNDSKEREQ